MEWNNYGAEDAWRISLSLFWAIRLHAMATAYTLLPQMGFNSDGDITAYFFQLYLLCANKSFSSVGFRHAVHVLFAS